MEVSTAVEVATGRGPFHLNPPATQHVQHNTHALVIGAFLVMILQRLVGLGVVCRSSMDLPVLVSLSLFCRDVRICMTLRT